jgi:spermidine/putrescine transport system permease protein
MKKINLTRHLSPLIVLSWVSLFILIPFVMILLTSFLTPNTEHLVSLPFTFNNYLQLSEWLYAKVFFRSLVIAGLCTFICLLIAFPFAFALSRAPKKWRSTLLLLVIIPFWTSSMLRTYAIMTLLKAHGLINIALLKLHFITHPYPLLYTPLAVMVGLVYTLLPLMILPLYANLEKLDFHLLEAAKDLGASRWRTLTKIIIPLSMPGVMAGILMVFLPAMTMFYITDILGGAKTLLLGNLIQMQFLTADNWPLGSAISILLIALLGILLLCYLTLTRHKNTEGIL